MTNLKELSIYPTCIIDKNKKANLDIPQYLREEMWPEIDVIIVTVTYDYGYIYEDIRVKKSEC